MPAVLSPAVATVYSQVITHLAAVSNALNMEQAAFEYRKALKREELDTGDALGGGGVEACVLADYHAEHMPDGLPLLLIRDHMMATAADQVTRPFGMSAIPVVRYL